VVERHVANVNVEGSTPFTRSETVLLDGFFVCRFYQLNQFLFTAYTFVAIFKNKSLAAHWSPLVH
jgi:hypothetical protein